MTTESERTTAAGLRGDQARALLAAIVAASDDAIVSKTLDGVILSWNAGAERLFGYTAAEAVGRSIDLIIPPELRDEERSILQRLRRGERIDHFETVRVTKDGGRIDISLTISPIRDEAGRIVGASKVARDITERRQAEERFRELANNIDQLVWICDELGHAIWYNRRWYDFTGTAFDDVRDEGWKALLHPDHLDRVVAGLQEATASGEPWEATFPLRGKDGEYRWFLSRAVPIRDVKGRPVRWLGTNTDVTRQRQAEEALRDADRRKDEFLATLSHELRNPLAPIRNSLEIMKEVEGDADAIRRARDTIERQLEQLVRLVDDLLDLSRVTRDKVALRRTHFELAPVVEQAVASFRPVIERRGQVLEVALPDETIHLDADTVRLDQVLDNLLSNASKYTDSGGTIRLSVERRGSHVVISVADDGIGIPPGKLDTIFEMFSQVDETLERSRGGLGIGLTLVKRLVELHGGSITAHSEGLGRGSEFVVRLPVAAGRAESGAAQPAPEAAAPEAASRRVLVVDDNRDSADSLAAWLELHGHRTRIAYDGAGAVEAAESFRPEVVLLDIGLPGMNGFDVCRRIRERPSGREAVIVALTGWGQEQDRLRSREAGFDSHMVKPPDHRALLDLLASSAVR